MKFRNIIRLTWISILAITIIFLLWQFIAPLGRMSYSSDFSKYNYFISELTPQERLGSSKGKVQNIVKGEPVYFYLRTLRPFTKVSVTINYKNPASLMELGICRDKAQWNFERLPIYFETLETLALADHTLLENGLLLWQKEKTYNSISDFLNHPPSSEKVGVYNTNFSPSFILQDYKPLPVEQRFDLGARGTYSLSTYSDGEPINLTFEIRKKNETKNSSPIVATMYTADSKIIETKTFIWPMAEETSDYQKQTFNFTTKRLSPAPYRLEFKAGDETETASIITTQPALSVINHWWLSDFGRSSFSIFTDATNISLQTINPKNLQHIEVGEQSLDLNETYKQFLLPLTNQSRDLKEIKLQKDDIMIAGDGVFALTPIHIIDPFPRQLTNTINLESSGMDYVIARYDPIGKGINGQRTVTFDLNQACLDKERYPFLISVPNVSEQNPVEISNLQISLQGKNLMQIIKTLWKRQ